MQIFLSIVFLFSFAHAECTFRPEVKKVFSLSGTATVIFKELGLLKKLSGITVFAPIKPEEFSGTIYPGGVFLSQGTLSNFEGSIVFYDESRDLEKTLKSNPAIKTQEIKTRDLSPLESINHGLEKISPFVVSCEKQFSSLVKKTIDLQNKFLKKVPAGLTVIFYLGEITAEKFPELVIVQDGVVKLLIDHKKVKTYPSDLAYVNWSAKIVRSMGDKILHVGIKDSGREGSKSVKKLHQKMTLIYPGSLVPGISQLEAFEYWVNNM